MSASVSLEIGWVEMPVSTSAGLIRILLQAGASLVTLWLRIFQAFLRRAYSARTMRSEISEWVKIRLLRESALPGGSFPAQLGWCSEVDLAHITRDLPARPSIKICSVLNFPLSA